MSARFTLYTPALLDVLREPEWLIENVLPKDAYAVLYGKSGAGKSFAALYLAFCVATGQLFFGRKVKQGPVVYVVLEGWLFFKRRLRALCKAHGITMAQLDDLYIINGTQRGAGPLLLQDLDSLQVLRDSLKEQHPEGFALVVVDTLARATAGLEENSNSDDARVSDAIADLKDKTRGAVLGVHHAGWEGTRMRGASARYAACDAVLKLSADDDGPGRVLELEKARDAQDGIKWDARLAPVGGDTVPVFLPSVATGALNDAGRWKVLECLRQAEPEGLTGPQWFDAAGGKRKEYLLLRRALLDAGLIQFEKRGNSGRFHLTQAGEAALAERTRQDIEAVA